MEKQNKNLNFAKSVLWDYKFRLDKHGMQRSYLPSHRLRSWKGAMSNSSFVPADSLDNEKSSSFKERIEKSW